MTPEEHRFWFRSSPAWGALGGMLVAAYTHLVGHFPDRYLLPNLVDLTWLFDISVVLGYAVLIVLGTVSGFVFRRFEDRFFYTE